MVKRKASAGQGASPSIETGGGDFTGIGLQSPTDADGEK